MIRGLALVAVTAVCGCGGVRPSPPVTASALEERAAAIDRDANSMMRKSGSLSTADASSKFEAFFEDGHLRLIAEGRGSVSENGMSINRYYFDDAVYFAFEEKTRRNLAPGAAGAPEKISLRIFFTPDGAAIGGRKSVGGERAVVEDNDARGALLHANALREAALKLP